MKIKNAWICQVENNSINPVFGEISFSEGKISNAKQLDHSSFNFQTKPEEDTIDAGGRLLTIPSVNFHDHFYSRLAKGLLLNGPMDNFTNILKNLWWKLDLVLDEEMVRASAQFAVIESIRNGVTYIFDHHSSPNFAEGSLETISEVLNECNLRGTLCFEVTDRNGEYLSESGIKGSESFLKSHSDNDNIKSILGLHASFTLNDSTLKKASELLKKFNCGIHIHLCEDKVDTEESLKKFKKLPIERLVEFGLLNNKSILAHGIYLNKDDLNIIFENGPAIVLNPDSNMNNAVGLSRLSEFPAEIPLLCGTDGMHSNPAKSLKQIFLLSRHSEMSFESAFNLVEKIYFDQIKFVKTYFPDFTSLKIGDRADFVIQDYIPPTPFLKDNFMGHYIYGITERPVHSVVQNGNILMDNFRISKNFDEYNINIKEQGNRLFNRLLNN